MQNAPYVKRVQRFTTSPIGIRPHPLHAKVALVDGVGYINERKWPSDGEDLILRDDEPKDVAIIRDAIAGETHSGSTLTTLKSDALGQEADVISHGRGKTLDVET